MSVFEAIVTAIECKICCEIISLRTLPCGHSLCEKCIELTAEEGRNFKCHFCNQKRKMPKGGFAKNFSINDISDTLKLISNPCPSHMLFSMNMKCMTCPDLPIICLQCYQLEHLGHYIIPSDWTIEKCYENWKDSFSQIDNFISKVPEVITPPPPPLPPPPPVEVSENSTQTDEILDLTTTTTSLLKEQKVHHQLSNEFQRGDCLLYLYHSQNNGEIYLGLAVVHRILIGTQISSRYQTLARNKELLENEDSKGSSTSYFESLERKLKRKRIEESLQDCQQFDILLKASPLKIQSSSPTSSSTSSSSGPSSTSSSSGPSLSGVEITSPQPSQPPSSQQQTSNSHSIDLYSVLITPSHLPLIDIPKFSIISSNITILLSGQLSADSRRIVTQATNEHGVWFENLS